MSCAGEESHAHMNHEKETEFKKKEGEEISMGTHDQIS